MLSLDHMSSRLFGKPFMTEQRQKQQQQRHQHNQQTYQQGQYVTRENYTECRKNVQQEECATNSTEALQVNKTLSTREIRQENPPNGQHELCSPKTARSNTQFQSKQPMVPITSEPVTSTTLKASPTRSLGFSKSSSSLATKGTNTSSQTSESKSGISARRRSSTSSLGNIFVAGLGNLELRAKLLSALSVAEPTSPPYVCNTSHTRHDAGLPMHQDSIAWVCLEEKQAGMSVRLVAVKRYNWTHNSRAQRVWAQQQFRAWIYTATNRKDKSVRASLASAILKGTRWKVREVEDGGPRLCIEDPIDLSHLTHLKCLPDKVNFMQGLRITGSSLEALPKEMFVGHSLVLHRCSNLRELPPYLMVQGTLSIIECSQLRRIYPHLYVRHDFYLEDCALLHSIGAHVHVQGSFFLRDVDLLKYLPVDLQVAGDVVIARCASLCTLSEAMRVGGSLHVDMCPNLVHAGPDLRVRGDLRIIACHGLQQLGTGHLSIGGSIDLASCSSLRSLGLGSNLRVHGNLNLRECSSLENLPRRLVVDRDFILLKAAVSRLGTVLVGRDLSIANCGNLISIGSHLQTGRNCCITNCPSLQTIGSHMFVGGNLDLSGDVRLAQFPEDVSLEGGLTLNDCVSLVRLPDNLYIDGDLSLRGCKLKSLPKDLHCTGSLSFEACDRIPCFP